MILPILKQDHKFLKKRSKRISKIDDSIRELSNNMIETMLSENGIGISGNQVGVLKRIIVVNISGKPEVMINPEILYQSKNFCSITEGCLSFPGEFYDIERPSEIKIKYRNISGVPIISNYSGLEARCILHEIDHINGITFNTK